ncbi:MAG TPA: zf-HC2 domain-containing protein [Terriglobales bacterium]|jgi:anti-sigma factor RsiW|nr:zf-HC2 domain-containing protein [Terriglobales bacterium]
MLMDHDAVVRQKMTERYLLNELDAQARDEFEEHYFDCPNCAADVHAGALFVEQSKAVLRAEDHKKVPSESGAPSVGRMTVPVRSGWFGWLRPAFAVPVLALLLGVIAYQNRANVLLRQAVDSPQVLASAVVNLNVRGAQPISVPTPGGQAFGLTLNLPPGSRFSSYKLDLYSPQGQLQWSRTVPASGDTLSLYVPAGVSGSNHDPGTLAVHGLIPDGESEDLGRYRIELQNQK